MKKIYKKKSYTITGIIFILFPLISWFLLSGLEASFYSSALFFLLIGIVFILFGSEIFTINKKSNSALFFGIVSLKVGLFGFFLGYFLLLAQGESDGTGLFIFFPFEWGTLFIFFPIWIIAALFFLIAFVTLLISMFDKSNPQNK